MHTLAILAPVLVDATPAQQARAQRAMMEQMMLLARGLSVDSLPVRCAAELVGSAIAPEPVEYELAPLVEGQEIDSLFGPGPFGGAMATGALGTAARLQPSVSADAPRAQGKGRVESEGRGYVRAAGEKNGRGEGAPTTRTPAWMHGPGYARYLRTVMSRQPD